MTSRKKRCVVKPRAVSKREASGALPHAVLLWRDESELGVVVVQAVC